MLVLARRHRESLILTVGDERVELIVTSITKGRVRLGIEASEKVKIQRSELEEKPDK